MLDIQKFDKIIKEGFTGKLRQNEDLKGFVVSGPGLRNEKGQAIVDYMLLIALILALISMVISMFEPRRVQMLNAIKANMQNVVSNGSLENGHPLEEGRVKEL